MGEHYLLDQVFAAEDLMTSVDILEFAEPGDLEKAEAKAKEKRYDVLPVVENERIVGVFQSGSTDYEPLTEKWLISRDTPIPDLLTLFVETGRPGFLVLYRQEVVGLVTPADLNKLPVRVYIYNVLSEVELKLAALIQAHFQGDSTRLHQALGDERWTVITRNNEALKKGNVDIDPVQLLYLNDLVNLVFTDESLQAKFEPLSKKALSKIVKLRNQTAHPVRALLGQVPKDLRKLHKRLSVSQEVLHRLSAT